MTVSSIPRNEPQLSQKAYANILPGPEYCIECTVNEGCDHRENNEDAGRLVTSDSLSYSSFSSLVCDRTLSSDHVFKSMVRRDNMR